MKYNPVILMPTYNNAATLAVVIEQVRACGLPVIVINDGSTDSTPEILNNLPDVESLTHPINRGKAAAIQTGLARSITAGFTHALTIDTDGQHNPSDIPGMIRRSQENPGALIVGARDYALPHYPAGNRLGRRISNFFVWLHSGVKVSDSQCGLRVYPVAIANLPTHAGRYGFETEILVRCGWAHLPVIDHPVDCVYEIATGRVSHFRPWRDSLRAVVMHARLLARSHWPIRPMRIGQPTDLSTTGTIIERLWRWFSPFRAWRAVKRDRHERHRFAAAISLGVFIANLPLYGIQTFLSLALAKKLNLHPLAVVTGSHLSTPPIGPLLILAALATGHFVWHGRALTFHAFDPQVFGYLELARRLAIEWAIGSIICGTVLAGVTYIAIKTLLHLGLRSDKI